MTATADKIENLNERVRDRSKQGRAIVVKLERGEHIAGSVHNDGSNKNGLDYIDLGNGMSTVVPCSLYNQGDTAVFIPAGMVAPDHSFFDWLGQGRKRVIRNRKFLNGYVSTGILMPVSMLSRPAKIGENIYNRIGVYPPVPPPPQRPRNWKIKERDLSEFCESIRNKLTFDGETIRLSMGQVSEEEYNKISRNGKRIFAYFKKTTAVPVTEYGKFDSKDVTGQRMASALLKYAESLNADLRTDGAYIYGNHSWHEKACNDAKEDLKKFKPYVIELLQARSKPPEQCRKELVKSLNEQGAKDIEKFEGHSRNDQGNVSPSTLLADANKKIDYLYGKLEEIKKFFLERYGYDINAVGGDVPAAVIGALLGMEQQILKYASGEKAGKNLLSKLMKWPGRTGSTPNS